MKMTNTIKPTHILVTDWSKHHSYPPIATLRCLIFNAKSNGFDSVVRRVGRRVLMDEDEYFKWVESNPHNKDGGAS